MALRNSARGEAHRRSCSSSSKQRLLRAEQLRDGLLRQGIAMKFQFISDHASEFEVLRMCRVLDNAPRGVEARILRVEEAEGRRRWAERARANRS